MLKMYSTIQKAIDSYYFDALYVGIVMFILKEDVHSRCTNNLAIFEHNDEGLSS